MAKYYFTFGQAHTHSVAGKTFDKDCVVEIEAKDARAARKIMFETFNNKWSMQYSQREINDSFMRLFPRGIIKL